MLTLEEVKNHCRVEQDFIGDDSWLTRAMAAAKLFVEKRTDRKFAPDDLEYNEAIGIAMLMLIAHWYENREAVNIGSPASTLDFAVDALLQPYRSYGL